MRWQPTGMRAYGANAALDVVKIWRQDKLALPVVLFRSISLLVLQSQRHDVVVVGWTCSPPLNRHRSRSRPRWKRQAGIFGELGSLDGISLPPDSQNIFSGSVAIRP